MGYIYGLDRKAARVLSFCFGIPEERFNCFFDEVYRSTVDPSDFYIIGQRAKSDGSQRQLQKPIGNLKLIQKAINTRLAPVIDSLMTPVATGYRPGCSIRANALAHIDSRSAVCLDIEDAFGSSAIHLSKPLRKMLQKHFGIESRYVIYFLEELITYENGLPQGAHTSPALFNLACLALDLDLTRLARTRNAVVTRYADNYVFSSPDTAIAQRTINAIDRIVTDDHGWAVNWRKYMVLQDCNRDCHPLRLPGVHIVGHRLRVPTKTLESLRTKLYNSLKEDNQGRARAIMGYVRWIEGEVPSRLAKVAASFGYHFEQEF